MNLQTIVKDTLEKGGVSYSLQFGDMSGKPFYALSTEKEREVGITPLSEFNSEIIRLFIKKNIDLLMDDEYVLGTWIQGKMVWLDVTRLIDKSHVHIETLKSLIKFYNQQSAFDLEEGKEVLK